MHLRTIARIIGFFALGFSLILLLPLLVAALYGEDEIGHFLEAMGATAAFGLVFLALGYRAGNDLHSRDGFLIVALFWFGLSSIASLPFMLSAHLEPVDALFEAVSAFTTTGATVISGLDELPKSFLFYRQLLQWLGGMGLIVLAVAVMPMLGIGGMQLYKAEAPGPLKEEKLTPRLSQTARYLWAFYVGMTLINALAYWLAGMDLFDAITHAFSTLSTGGFSTHDASIGYFDSALIEMIAVIFMIMGAINFSVHFLAWRHRSLREYLHNVEVRVFLLLIVAAVLVIAGFLWFSGEYPGYLDALRNSLFEVVSVITSTGFGTVDFSLWPSFVPVLLIFISFIGGCGGSTAGGMKVMRVILLTEQGWREVRRLIHPRAKLPIRIGDQVVSPQTVQGVWGFMAAYVVSFVILMLLMMAAGLDQVSAFSAIATSMNNLGPGLGAVSSSFAGVSDAGKLVASFAMLLGRLEVFTIIVLLTPEFWRS
ncbi:MAG: potassium transporter [Gammaproteobacteria bacterium]|nr:MAG: potassium transporter [Gammaproteobacteria bacterium]